MMQATVTDSPQDKITVQLAALFAEGSEQRPPPNSLRRTPAWCTNEL
jgi:hypothetical protein